MINPIIELKGLSKRYHDKIVVDSLSLEINKGEVFGLLGPNGAGKTTTILMMMGLCEPSAGKSLVCGYDSSIHALEVKKKVGYMPDNMGFYEGMSAIDNLMLIGELNGLSSIEAHKKGCELLEVVGLGNNVTQRVGTFSRGMKQRLGLADVLMKNPEVIILDEPTLGIDPSGVRDFLKLIKDLSSQKNITVLLSSHHLHHVQEVCDRVGIFVNGQLLACGEINSLAQRIFNKQGYSTIIELAKGERSANQLKNILEELDGVVEVEVNNNQLEVTTKENQTAHIVRFVVERGYDVIGINRKSYGLDDVYMAYFSSTIKSELNNEKPKRKKSFEWLSGSR